MRVGLLLEAIHPRPWTPGADGRRLRELVDLAVRAEGLGVGRVWVPERHFQEELHHGGPPEALLGAIAARTRRLGLGLGPLPAHPLVQHPARTAAAVAALDAFSGGRVALAFAVPAAAIELGPFRIPRADAAGAALTVAERTARLVAEEPFAGAEDPDGLPVRQVVPRPAQRPHPGIWWACDRPDDVRTAALAGLGALVRAGVEPEEAGEWAREHARLQRSDAAQPVGAAIETGVAVCVPVHVGADAASALDEGLDAVHLHRYLTDHFGRFGAHRPGRTSAADEFARRRTAAGYDPAPVRAAAGAPLALRVGGSVRGAVGDPDGVLALLERYRDAGVDEVVLVPPLGALPAAAVRASLERLGRDVLPRLGADEDDEDAVVAEDAALVAALRRRRPAPAAPETVVLAREDAVPDDAPPPVVGLGTVSGAVEAGAGVDPAAAGTSSAAARASAAQALGGLLRRRSGEALGALLDRGGPVLVRRTVASEPALRVVFRGMARALRPAAHAGEFRGELQFDLLDADGRVRAWTVEAGPVRSAARRGPSREPTLVLRLASVDLLRLVSGRLDAGAALLDGRLDLEGDLSLAVRMGDLFRR